DTGSWRLPMTTIHRSALVAHSASRMFELVHDVAAYPRRFNWCRQAQVLDSSEDQVFVWLDLGLGALTTWFTTRNTFSFPHNFDLALVYGPFSKLSGCREFHALDESVCRISLIL